MAGKNPSTRYLTWLGLIFMGFALTAQKAPEPTVEPEKDSSLKGRTVTVRVQTADLTEGDRLRALMALVDAADQEGAEKIIFEIDTAQGYSAASGVRLLEALPRTRIRKIAWVDGGALGLGALLAVSSDEIWLSPSSVLGGAMPNHSGGSSDDEDEDGVSADTSQDLSVLKALIRSTAARTQRSSELLQSMVDPSVELKSGDRVLSAKGEVLTLTAEEALMPLEDGKVLANGVSVSMEEAVPKPDPVTWVRTNPSDWKRDLKRDVFTREDDPQDNAEEKEEEAPTSLFGKAEEASYKDQIVIMEVGMNDLVANARFDFMKRVIEKAREDGASALILDMDTPGGLAWNTTDIMMTAMQDLPFETFTFVNPRAKSAGALIAIATDKIYMKPTSTIGSALPVMGGGMEIPETMKKKLQADMASTVRNVAISKGHDPDLAEAFITTETRVEKDGVVIVDVGDVLDLNALEATEIYNGEPLLAAGIVRSIDELIETEGLEGETVRVKPQGMERFAHWVQIFGGLLIAVGIGGAYLEINSPGFGIPGIASVLAFTIFFFGNYAAGNLAGFEVAVIFILGLLLVLVDVLFFAGSFLIGILGALLMVGALIFALVDRVEFGELVENAPAAPSFVDVFAGPLWTMTVGLTLSVVFILALMRFLPKAKHMQWLTLESALPGGGSIQLDGSGLAGEAEKPALRPGLKGRALSNLQPAGRAVFGNEVLDVTSESRWVEKDAEVEIVEVSSFQILVTPVESAEVSG